MKWYTKIIDTDGVEYAIFAGVATDDTYKVGDAVPQAPLSEKAGKGAFLDGLYFATKWDCEDATGRWVVIAEAKVKAVIGPFPRDTKTGDTIPPRSFLFRQQGCRRLPLDAWTDWAWAQKAKDEELERIDKEEREADLWEAYCGQESQR